MLDILKILRHKRGVSQRTVAEYLGITQQAYANYESGRRSPDNSTLMKIADYFGVSTDCLLGKEEPSSGPASTGGVWIPVLGKIAAGVPIEAIEEILDYEEISKDMAVTGDHFGLQIQGSSMEPKISEGDVVIVRQQEDVDSGDIAVILVNGEEATVKRVQKGPEGIILIPSNPKYQPIFFSNKDVAELPVKILGKVVELRAKFI